MLSETGTFSLSYEELGVGDKISFNVTLKPRLTGVYDSTRARIKYTTGADMKLLIAFRIALTC
jgi:hypothetical protein